MKCYWGLRSEKEELDTGTVIPMESLKDLCVFLFDF